jgi:isopenicillin N synthase-like dioxygenase
MNKQAVGYDGDKLTRYVLRFVARLRNTAHQNSFAASEGISFGTPAGGILASDNLPSYWDQSKRIEIESFKASCKQLSDTVMACYAIELGLDQHYFAQNHEEVAPGNTLRMIKYPRFTEKPSDIPRLSEHTDWGSITFVFTSQPGLEVRDPNNRWYDVPLVDDAVIVNIGDALSLWTGKQLKSTMHRISWANLDINKDRYSIAYFTNPNLG